LPPIEAFHHGLPVVCSRAACIPEVVGDAALLFDPYDVGSITAALKQAVEQPELLASLRERGRHRLDTAFPKPEKLARMFTTVYAKTAGLDLDDAEHGLLQEMLS
jgi:glycosyltransferase involved in cell wall biosynthesis